MATSCGQRLSAFSEQFTRVDAALYAAFGACETRIQVWIDAAP